MNDGQVLALHDPAARAIVEALIAAQVLPVSAHPVAAARQATDQLSASAEAATGTLPDPETIFVPGSPDVECIVVRPSGAARGLMVYFHGGGWVIGSPRNYLPFALRLCAATDCIVLMPRYRLAPEAPFPAAVQDAVAAVRWIGGEGMAALGGEGLPVIVAGDSAGGNLAAVSVQQLHESQDIAAQLLIYPVTDADFSRDSYRRLGAGSMLTTSDMEWFWAHYAPRAADRLSPLAAPLRADSVSGLPPAIIVAAEVDPLVDEGKAYAARLEEAGVPVIYREMQGMPHGFINMFGVLPGADEAIDFMAAALSPFLTATA